MSMMKLRVLLIVMAAAGACKSKEDLASGRERAGGATGEPATTAAGDGPTTKPGEPEDTKRGTRQPGPEDHKNLTGARPRQAANCPATLPGASTKIAMTPQGVDVTVTSTDASTERSILALAVFHAHGQTAEVSRPHDGKHGASGWIGYCPIIVNEMTQVTTTAIPGGAILHVNARSPSQVKEVQSVIKQRAERLPGYLSS
jgi:TusA-related sulfurtransferase